MFAVAVTIEVFPNRMAEFKPAMMENARASLAEPACNRFDVLSDPSRPDEVFLYELYDDEAGFEAHHQTSHYKAFDTLVTDMIRRKSIKTYAVVEG
ncbi:MAG: putative quinol monooxygenase [Jannaschia helgolandensis]|jgi:(4S)-4-hydroxy-5-phosphonooxypentane-2,3-dione isomerase|uniref:Quinol monooxygenase YgiN n=1 Tax=Jannaschia helgolandensis TaxID=188906 RepID=A0A1H7MY00_9RHOB|nr:putative quinol monooxygenase [Jannaschia helgolandensis]SEL15648.1 Quinol monooxygenase YgiN [Jannaschia helgolandensis]|tara:strand:- start:219 stop:506 length:288 start_codon:yes stop_codon:yes gene_type:complete